MLLLLASFLRPLHAEQALPTENERRWALSDFCFEITRYAATGFSALSEAALFAPISARAAQILTQPLFDRGGKSLLLCDLVLPEKKGLIEATYSSSDCVHPSLADWVDTALVALSVAVPESEPLLDDELFFAVDASDVLSALDNRADAAVDASQADSEGITPRTFTDGADKLRRFTYGVESFSVNELDGMLYLTDCDDKRIVRRAYDADMRLACTEIFAVPADSRALTCTVRRFVRYNDESRQPYEQESFDYSKKTRAVTRFTENGLTDCYELFHTEEITAEPEKSTKGKKDKKAQDAAAEEKPVETREVQDSKTLWAYDEQNRVLAEESTTWQTEKTKKGEKRTAHTVKRVYDYSGKGEKPDSAFYENGILRIRTVYESPAVYTETLYFDGGYSVQTTYENRNKTLEIILLDGKEQRRRSFAY